MWIPRMVSHRLQIPTQYSFSLSPLVTETHYLVRHAAIQNKKPKKQTNTIPSSFWITRWEQKCCVELCLKKANFIGLSLFLFLFHHSPSFWPVKEIHSMAGIPAAIVVQAVIGQDTITVEFPYQPWSVLLYVKNKFLSDLSHCIFHLKYWTQS